jgi:hypothetical protein
VRHVRLLQPELVTKYGYPAETHTVLTADGYFLTLHRIPRGRHNTTQQRRPVILQHGILSSSADWVILGPDKALGMCFISIIRCLFVHNTENKTSCLCAILLITDANKISHILHHVRNCCKQEVEVPSLLKHRELTITVNQ